MMPSRAADAFGRGHVRPADGRAIRHFSVRHSRFFERVYAGFERILIKLAPLFGRIGLDRLERPMAVAEKAVKTTLFDCRMCGQCVLSSTGMSCPMNCPKNLRNGPCGGVRLNGNCEVHPNMACVWVKAYEGSTRMEHGGQIRDVQPPIDHRRAGWSSWLEIVRRHAAS